MSKVLMIHPDKCNGCRECELACSARQNGEFRQPLSLIRVGTFEREGLSVPSACQQCYTAACVAVCPTSALTNNREAGVVELNRSNCNGCRLCVIACPFGNAEFDEETKAVLRCDLCDGDPECVKVCKPRALEYVENCLAAASRKQAAMKRRYNIAK